MSSLTQDGLYESITKIIELGFVHQGMMEAQKLEEDYIRDVERGINPLKVTNKFMAISNVARKMKSNAKKNNDKQDGKKKGGGCGLI